MTGKTLTARPRAKAEPAPVAEAAAPVTGPTGGKGQNLQDLFLNHLRKN
ncbi:MAG: RNA-binding protein hfq, partial [Novosphingobium sp. 35-62-5]